MNCICNRRRAETSVDAGRLTGSAVPLAAGGDSGRHVRPYSPRCSSIADEEEGCDRRERRGDSWSWAGELESEGDLVSERIRADRVDVPAGASQDVVRPCGALDLRERFCSHGNAVVVVRAESGESRTLKLKKERVQ
jgi:hypothetical protein